MAHDIGYVDDSGSEGYAHWQMLRRIRDFAGGYGTFDDPTFSGTGSGKLVHIDTDPDAVTETWTIECTDATTEGAETWSVTGSVSGAQADATTGVAYSISLLSFSIDTGATAFNVGDKFTLDVTAGAMDASERWEVLRYLTPDGDDDRRELILKGQGLSGAEEIFIGLRAYQGPSSDWYNMALAAFTGYIDASSFEEQPGYKEMGLCAHNRRIDYWLAVNGQRILIGMKVGTPVYEVGYVGKFLPYAVPTQYPYPIAVIGTLSSAKSTRYSDTGSGHSCGAKGGGNGYLRTVSGSWLRFDTLPFIHLGASRRDTGGHYQLLAATVCDGSNVYGALDGLRYITGFDQITENKATIDGTDHVVIQDVFRTGFGDYFALEMK